MVVAQSASAPVFIECSGDEDFTGIFKITDSQFLRWDKSSASYRDFVDGGTVSVSDKAFSIRKASYDYSARTDTGNVEVDVSRIDGSARFVRRYNSGSQYTDTSSCKASTDPAAVAPVF